MHDVILAQEEVRRRVLGKAVVAARERRSGAQTVPARGHHLAIMMADGKIFMQREHDPGIGQAAADQLKHLDAEIDVVVKMHHVRPQIAQQHAHFLWKARIVIGEAEPIERAAAVDEFTLAKGLRDRGPQPAAMPRPGAAEKPGIDAGRMGKRRIKRMRGNLRAAFGDMRMGVARDHDPRASNQAAVLRAARRRAGGAGSRRSENQRC